MSRKLHKALREQKQNTQQVPQEIYGTLFAINGLVEVKDRPSFVNVQLRDNQNEIIQAFNNKVAASPDLPVIVHREGNRYIIQGVNTQRYQNTWNNYASYLPKHGTAHSFADGGGGDISWIFSRQFMPNLVYPNGGGTTGSSAYIAPHVLLLNNETWAYTGATGTPDLIQYKGTGSSSAMILVYLDANTGNPGILVGSGSYFPNALTGTATVFPYIPVPNRATQIPLAAVRMDTGTAGITWDNLYDVRQWIHALPSGTSSGGGGGGGIDTIGFAGLANGVPIGTGTILNVQGAGATFTRSGTVFNLDIPGMSTEEVQDIVGGMVSGSAIGSVIVLYNDATAQLEFSLDNEAIQDIVGGMVSGNVETGISVTYDDTNGKLDFDVPVMGIPGGRLSLATGTPVTISDVTGATNIYYVPSIHNRIILWDGSAWNSYATQGATLAVGSLATGTAYDVFGFLSGGTLALESLAWSNSTTRATPITSQDGRYCKSGDKSRLYLGSFYPTSTTTTADAETTRFLWNMYNRIPRSLVIVNGNSHNYNTNTVRAWNNTPSASDVEFFVGLVEDAVNVHLTPQITRIATDGNPRSSFGVNSTTVEQGNYGLAVTTVGRTRAGSSAVVIPSLGYSFLCILEFSTVGTPPGATFETASLNGVVFA